MNDHPSSGEYSLESLSEAVRYNRFIYTRMLPYLSNQVLELGTGIGNLTPFFLEEERSVVAIDIDEALIEIHRRRVSANPRLSVQCISIQNLARQPGMGNHFDAVVSSNVLEHIPDGEVEDVVRAMRTVLKPGGYAVHWVPALPGLFGSLDRAFKHYRRYTTQSATLLFREAGLNVVSASYWNMTGVLGWLWYGRVLGKESIPRSSALMFDKLMMPIVAVLEPKVWRPFGQSLLLVAQKGNA